MAQAETHRKLRLPPTPGHSPLQLIRPNPVATEILACRLFRLTFEGSVARYLNLDFRFRDRTLAALGSTPADRNGHYATLQGPCSAGHRAEPASAHHIERAAGMGLAEA